MVRRRRHSRRKARVSPQGALIGLVFFLIISFFFLDFLYKWKEGAGRSIKQVKQIEKIKKIEQVEKIEQLGQQIEQAGESVKKEKEPLESKVGKEVKEIGIKVTEGIRTEAEPSETGGTEELLPKLKEEKPEEAKEEKPITLPPPRVALIIDDLGYSLRAAKPLLDIKYPLTLSILPGLRYSVSLAKRMSQPPFEATLHLPLEPEGKGHLERGTIMVDMSEEKVRDLMEKHLSLLLPYIKGVNGHMGSKATADKRIMSIVLEEVKKRDLYFVDSYTTDKSVALEVARGLGLKTASRQVFLDSGRERNNPDYIRARMEELADIARKEGKAVGIGHPRPLTLKIVQEMMPKLAKEGILFVTASEVVE
ncbi:MAG: divergent polysaccharide deacetylase family protein [Nitrospirae bacterium]|nr:divergent polysaccharide deacetylase family protein [Nitrospirota bacterium]